jgi:hypothetical protein
MICLTVYPVGGWYDFEEISPGDFDSRDFGGWETDEVC